MTETENPDLALAPVLYELADSWPLYADVTERPCIAVHELAGDAQGWVFDCGQTHLAQVRRCRDCGEEVFPIDQTGILRHMFTSHGYRMDGRRFDNSNREIPHDR